MVNIVTEIAKYLLVILIAIYTFESFIVFGYDEYTRRSAMKRQTFLVFLIHFIAFLVLFLGTNEMKIAYFYFAQVVLLLALYFLYTTIYPKVSKLVVNHMCILLAIGFILLTRLAYDKAVRQFIFATISIVMSLLVPVIIRKVKVLENLRKLYGLIGVIALFAVIIAGSRSGGALLGFTIGPVSIQPSELVKIVFVFFVAASFKETTTFKNVVITSCVAAAHVLILVSSRDLGMAIIIFMTYLMMLYVATRQPLYLLAGLGAGSAASIVAHRFFSHVRVRVNAWRDPFEDYQVQGYQIAQSLFAIGTGSWFGVGLLQGMPDRIPVASEDFVFSALCEEMGLLFGICLVLICLSCYIMFLNIAMQLRNVFYKLVALGLGTCYIFQVFLNIGGVTKFIPSTGVTIPFVSYGGSSLLSTLIMFAIIQGLYILREDEEDTIEREKEKQAKTERKRGRRDL